MENYNFSALSISIQTDAQSSQSGKQFSSPLKSDKTNFLDLDNQKQINDSAQFSQVDISIQKDCEEKAAQTSEQKSNSLCESQLKQTKVSQNKKKLAKRCQTTLLIGQSIHKHNSQKAEKYFIKKNNQIIEKSFEKIKGKISNFSRMFLTNIRQLQKPIQVHYFRSTITKVLVIDQDMLAAEFIVLALKQFQNDVKLDQSLYEFPNYSLAYQIEGQDDQQDLDEFQYRRQPQRYKSFGSLEDKMKSRRESLNEIDYDQKPVSQFEISLGEDNDDRIIQIDLESPMRYYKSVDIVPILDSTQLDFDLQMAKIVYQQHPNHILILIEEPISKGRFHIKIQPNMKANKKYRTTDYNLILKYPCIHMSTEPINLKIPISKLPIHQLILTQKFQNEANRSLRQFQDSYTININKDTIFSRSINKSYRFLQEEGKSNEYTDKVRTLYSYQEFQLLKIDKQFRNNVILGIDYFDLYYSYTQERQRKFTLGKFCKSISQYLIEEPIVQKDYRRLPLNKILNVESTKDFELIISYEKSQNYKKQIHFGIDLNQEKSKIDLQQKTIMNAYNKLEYLVDLYIKYKQQL
ncbi:unnamed protein product (macronuclear) [Paramecium tetraurelia]|uniref:SAPK-interacting protein 1 Pleckstrin-homology domain-containing protein n=1 Tax=Paramecium tetraurelia TaxID=5888 RepID=A0CSK0_PARTE|nr:uncharacterized protein GSPATT00010039001 [Paramecium tetraurelia]CAK73767.1 unnamed protein product [Paramecium tetraurelia]|eukprot:XP_001441164.1 hypothetical protein (macronuclear) [Paramecium tetraurelia strain d4-2]